MTIRLALASVAALAAVTASPAVARQDKPEHVYGPEPSWGEYRRLAEAAIAAKLIDPESARFTWLTGIHKGGIRAFLSGKVEGYAACGQVNAKNRLGGYTGATTFLVAIDYGRVLSTAMDTRPGGMYEEACARVLTSGLYPPPPDPSGSVASAPGAVRTAAEVADPDAAPLPNDSTGLALRAMPDGAYVTQVTPGSLAAAAGLKPGMVITTVNAIPLVGMGEAMSKVINAAGPRADLTLVGGARVKLGGPR